MRLSALLTASNIDQGNSNTLYSKIGIKLKYFLKLLNVTLEVQIMQIRMWVIVTSIDTITI